MVPPPLSHLTVLSVLNGGERGSAHVAPGGIRIVVVVVSASLSRRNIRGTSHPVRSFLFKFLYFFYDLHRVDQQIK